MSVSRHCEFWLAADGKWYMDLAVNEYQGEDDDYDGSTGDYDPTNGTAEDSITYGPFPSEEAADRYLSDNFSNPGSTSADDSGTRPPPKKSPNGSPVVRPRGGLGGAASSLLARPQGILRSRPAFAGQPAPPAPTPPKSAALPAKMAKTFVRKAYAGGKGKSPVTRIKGKLYRGPKDSKAQPGVEYQMKMSDFDDKLHVSGPRNKWAPGAGINPDSNNRTQMWSPEEDKTKKEGLLRSFVREALLRESVDDDVNSIEVGDMVDVDMENMGILPVRVVELIDDISGERMGLDPEEAERMGFSMSGPGFVGDIDPRSGESGELVFSLDQVVPGSKAKYFFPKLGAEMQSGAYEDWDEYGRDVANPYRKMASKQSTMSRERG